MYVQQSWLGLSKPELRHCATVQGLLAPVGMKGQVVPAAVAVVVKRVVGAVTDVCRVDAVLALVTPVLGVCVLKAVLAETVLAWRQYVTAPEIMQAESGADRQ